MQKKNRKDVGSCAGLSRIHVTVDGRFGRNNRARRGKEKGKKDANTEVLRHILPSGEDIPKKRGWGLARGVHLEVSFFSGQAERGPRKRVVTREEGRSGRLMHDRVP